MTAFPLTIQSVVKLEPPIVFEIGKYGTFPFKYTGSEQSLEISRTMHVSLNFENIDGKQKIQVKIADITPPITFVNQYLNAEDLIMRCVRNAELINNSLRWKILQLVCKTTEEKFEVNKMDFMKLKTCLFEYLKKNINLINALFQDEKVFKKFRVLLNNFILDRNKYTHGVLHFHLNTNRYFIAYKEGMNDVVADVTARMLTSFNDAYLLIADFLNELQIQIGLLNKA